MSTLLDLAEILKGGTGSGNFGHAGIPGHQGGSVPGSGFSNVTSEYANTKVDSFLEDWRGRDLDKNRLLRIVDDLGGLKNLGEKSVWKIVDANTDVPNGAIFKLAEAMKKDNPANIPKYNPHTTRSDTRLHGKGGGRV